MGATRSLFVVGNIPPPATGASVVTEQLVSVVDELATDCEVSVFNWVDRSVGRSRGFLYRLSCSVRASWQALRTGRDATMYFQGASGEAFLLQYLMARVVKLRGVRTVYHHHSRSPFSSPQARFRRGLQVFDSHIVLSEKMGAQVTSLYGIEQSRQFTVSNGLFVEARFKAHLQSLGSNQSSSLRAVFVGTLSYEKGAVDAVDVCGRLQRALRRPVKLSVVGSRDVGSPIDKAIASSAHLAGIEVEHIGAVYDTSALADIYNNSDVMVFPTSYREEASPMVLFEASLFGLGIVTRDIGYIAEIPMDPERTVFIDEPDSLDHLPFLDVEKLASSRTQNPLVAESSVIDLDTLETALFGLPC